MSTSAYALMKVSAVMVRYLHDSLSTSVSKQSHTSLYNIQLQTLRDHTTPPPPPPPKKAIFRNFLEVANINIDMKLVGLNKAMS